MRRAIIGIALIVWALSIGAGFNQDEEGPGVWLEQAGFEKIYATAYCMGHHTANGSKVHSGGCACSADHLGDVAIIYTLDGHFLGYYECNDTGGTPGLQLGNVVDIYRCNYTQCNSFMKITGGKVYIKWIEGEG